MSEDDVAWVLAFLSTVACLVIGVFSLAIALRERERSSAAWAWVVPGVGGIVLLMACLLRMWWWST